MSRLCRLSPSSPVTPVLHRSRRACALRTAPGLVEDGVRSQTFLDQQRVFDPGYGVDRNYWKGHFARGLPDELIDELLVASARWGVRPGRS